MENYIYFSDGDGADATGDAGAWAASNFIGATPLSTTTTGVYFAGQTGVGDAPDLITLTHDNTTTTTGHRVQDIAKAMAKILNAGPHAGGSTITAVDLTNSVKAEGLSFVTGVAITIDS
jgi:hypothetical protein